jgi:glucuronoarabinoxylan endo-1,4-beta-xylanase
VSKTSWMLSRIAGFGLGLATMLATDVVAATVTITPSTKYQKMSGFGASTAWASSMSATDANLLWDTVTGAGLSLHRIHIDDQGATSETNIAKLAVARGVKVWAAPWNPQAAWLQSFTSGKTTGKELNPSYAQAWATMLAKFPTTMKAAGVPIYALSVQNEMDNAGSNHFTPAQLVSFVKTYLGPAMKNTGTVLMAPETQNWCDFRSYLNAILGDATVSSYVSIIATHEYGCSDTAYPAIANAGKEFWETEMYDWASSNEDPGMTSALRTAKLMHEALTISNVSAWHFWWVYPCAEASCGNGALWSQGSNSKATKRLWIMGNYSRFVRPGFQRIEATEAPTSGVTLTAYRDASLSKIVVVAINTNTSATSQAFSIAGTAPTKVTPHVTDPNRNLSTEASQTLTSGSFTYSLPATSVTTLVFDLPTSTAVEPAVAPAPLKVMGRPIWSAGVLSLSGAGNERIQLVNVRGESRTLELKDGMVRTGPLSSGMYQVRFAEGSRSDRASFFVLR